MKTSVWRWILWTCAWIWTALSLMMSVMALGDGMVVACVLLVCSSVLTMPLLRRWAAGSSGRRIGVVTGRWLSALAGIVMIGMQAKNNQGVSQSSPVVAMIVLVLIVGLMIRDAWRRISLRPAKVRSARAAPIDTSVHSDNVRGWIAKNRAAIRENARRNTAPPVGVPQAGATSGSAWKPKKPPPSKPVRSARASRADVGAPVQDGPPGSRLTFEYADIHGEITKRSLTNWVEYSDHIRGYCSKRKAVRTFRKDGVQDWIAGHDHLLLPD